MGDRACAYCMHAEKTSTTPPGKVWCKNLRRTMEKTDGKNCSYFR
jgi:hypothetical protein